MQGFKQLTVIEKHELDKKREKLEGFLLTEDFDTLEKLQKEKLCRQLKWMNGYSAVLGERIDEF